MSDASGIGNLQSVLSSVNLTPAKPAAAPAVSAARISSDGDGDHGVEASGAAPADRTVLSQASGVVAQALATTDVRTEKVSALKQAIEAGTYSVPAAQVADKVISSLLR